MTSDSDDEGHLDIRIGGDQRGDGDQCRVGNELKDLLKDGIADPLAQRLELTGFLSVQWLLSARTNDDLQKGRNFATHAPCVVLIHGRLPSDGDDKR
jgi:hypothetical protein